MQNPDILLTLKLGDKLFADRRRVALLKAINETGSLSQAASKIGMSYKAAWDALNEINQLSSKPFVITATGGKGGGGSKLSAYAERFITLYELLTKIQQNAFNVLNDDSVELDDVLKVAAKLSLQTSARNQLFGTVKAINVTEVAGFVDVLLSDNKTVLSAYVTHASIERLGLKPNKSVILLIKAPQIELSHLPQNNHYPVTIIHIAKSKHWCELTLQLESSITIFATRPIDDITYLNLEVGKQIHFYINPENIIVSTINMQVD
ncbi:TOBE domain-containing protein [Orbaceae bacterium ac157xtp]